MKSPDHDAYFRFASVTAFALMVLTGIGYFFPGGLIWGISLTGFLHPAVPALVAVAAAGALFLFRGKETGGRLERLCIYLDRRPFIPVALSAAVFIALAIILRVRASVLGDSYTLIYNFLDYQNGVSILAPWHEPLSIYVLYYVVHAIGPLQFPEIYTSFSIVQIVFGVGFIVVGWYIVRILFTSPVERILTFLLLLTLPYMEFFMGYIEVYSVSTLLLALYILASLLVIRQKLTFAVLPSLYLFLTLSHYINGLFCFAMLYSLWLDYREHRWRRIVPGVIAATVIGVAILFFARFEITRLIDVSPISHFLSLTSNITPINAYSQAYTVFSLYHAVDIANYLVFMSPVAVAFFIWRIFSGPLRIPRDNPTELWLLIATIPLFLFLCVAKLEQGFASDWDVFAAHFFLLNILFAYRYHRLAGQGGHKVFAVIVAITFIFSAPWFLLNATRDPSIRRLQSLWDQRILSHLGHYTHTQRLTRFYAAEGEPATNAAIWKKYTTLFPGDPRGYENEIAVLTAYAPDSLTARDSAYTRWLSVDPQNTALRKEYAGFCATEASGALAKNDTSAAIALFTKAVVIDPAQSRAYNNIGSLYAQSGDIGRSIPMFEKAIANDSTFGDAYYNLGIALETIGENAQAFRMVERSASLGNQPAEEYLRTMKKNGPR